MTPCNLALTTNAIAGSGNPAIYLYDSIARHNPVIDFKAAFLTIHVSRRSQSISSERAKRFRAG